MALAVVADLVVSAGYLATLPAIPSPASRVLGAAPPGAESVSFRSRDGIDLRGWWMPAVGAARATVILAHGRDANRSFMVSRAAAIVGRDARAPAVQKVGLRAAAWLERRAWGRAFADWAFHLRTGVRMDPCDADALPAVAALGARPVLVIAGAQDALATPEDARRLYDAARSRARAILIVPGAGHNTTYATAPALYETTVLRFLAAIRFIGT